MRKSFTIACRDVTDASGHKHGADGRFGSGGGTAKPKRKLGDAAKKHSAAAHEAKTYEAHSKAGKAHAAVARIALKRGDVEHATLALASAKLHQAEAKKLKSAAPKPGSSAAPKPGGLVHIPSKSGAGSSGPKTEAPKSNRESKPTRSDSPKPHVAAAKAAADRASVLELANRLNRLRRVDNNASFSHDKHDRIAASHGQAADAHEAAAASYRGDKRFGSINDAGEHVTGNHYEAEKHDQAAKLHREAQKAHEALGEKSQFAKLLRLAANNPNVNEAQSALETAKAKAGPTKNGNFVNQTALTKAAANASKATRSAYLQTRALGDLRSYSSDSDDDDDVEPDDSIDLDSEIEELEKLIAQKRYPARPFTIRRVPISSKG